MSAEPIIRVQEVKKAFGGVQAVKGFRLRLPAGTWSASSAQMALGRRRPCG